MKKITVLILLMLGAYTTFAQPANDEPCNALALPIIESADGCTPVVYNITGATFTSIPGTFVCNNNPDVWLKFNTPDQFLKLRFGGSNVTFTTYTYSTCSANLQDQLTCIDSATWSGFGNNIAFFPNTNQLIRIESTNGSANFSFSICLTLLRPGAEQRVGVNTKLPQANFDVAGKAVFRDTLSISNVLRFNNGGQGSNRILKSDAGGYAFWGDLPTNYWTASGSNIYNNNSGNVGIGNTAPSAPLSFLNSNGAKISFNGSNLSAQYGIGIQNNLLQLYSDASVSDISFGYGGSNAFTERMRIKGNGNVGIGTNNPTRPLSFPASLGEKILLYPGGAGEVGIGVYGNELRLHSDNPGAAVSFGTQDNAAVFTQAGRFQISGAYGLFVNGSIWANGTTYASDERFKQNITAIQSPLQKLVQINGVEYEMKTGSFQKNNFQKGRQMGLLAQNVEKIVPEAVNEIDGYKGVDYARLVPLLIEAIKEQQKQIDEQRKIIEGLLKK